MRTTILSFLATAALVAPLAAQQTRSPAPARRPAVAAIRGDSGTVPRLTEAQHDKLDAIRSRYAKERRAEREASQARNTKMRAEINAVLTPEQRARVDQRGQAMHGSREGMRVHRAGARGAMPMRGGQDGMRGRKGFQGMGGQMARPPMPAARRMAPPPRAADSVRVRPATPTR